MSFLRDTISITVELASHCFDSCVRCDPCLHSKTRLCLQVFGICRCSAGWIKLWRSCGASMSSGGTVSSVTWCWLLMTSGSLLTEPSLPFPAHTSTPCSPWAWGRSARRRYKRIVDHLEPADLFLWNGERWWSRKPRLQVCPLWLKGYCRVTFTTGCPARTGRYISQSKSFNLTHTLFDMSLRRNKDPHCNYNTYFPGWTAKKEKSQ